jgi:hypothetical protein
MLDNCRMFARSGFIFLLLAIGFSSARAQDSALEEIKYKEDYDRIQSIMKVSDVQKRADRIIALYKDRRDMDPKLQTYIDSLFVRDLDNLMKAQNFAALGPICDRTLKARPRFGEAYLYQGIVLKNAKKNQEAMTAFARGYVIDNPLKPKSKQQLDLLYRAANGGSLIGQEKFLKEAMKELK